MDVAALTLPATPLLVLATQGGPLYDADRAAQRDLLTNSVQTNHAARATAIAFNWWGGPGVVWFAALLWLGARLARRRTMAELGLRSTEGIAVSSAISGIVKGLAGRARPFVAPGEPWHWQFANGWTDARYFSMPSGHTTACFAVAAAASLTVARWRPAWRAVVVSSTFATALLVAFARVFANQHWLSDVVAGAVLGMCTGFAIAHWHGRHPQSSFDRALLGSTQATGAR